MSKYTKAQIIKERRCGLKHLDKALTKVSAQELVDHALRIFRDADQILPDDPWGRFGWAIANAVKETLHNWECRIGANLDEMFDDTIIQYISDKIEVPLPDTDARRRKKADS